MPENLWDFTYHTDGRVIRACGCVEYEGCCKKKIGHELHCRCDGRKKN